MVDGGRGGGERRGGCFGLGRILAESGEFIKVRMVLIWSLFTPFLSL